ncbi:MAG: response regulator [Magnetococcales bacterium]|nr:response regulator [Magnetococcales bacterium]
MAEILRKAGHTVIEAENGCAGFEKIKVDPVDLTITDIFMPEMDGIDLLAAILQTYPNSKVIAITGGYKAMYSHLTLKLAQSFGAVDIITKPFQVDQVIRKVALALQSMDIQAEEGVMT